MAHSVFIFINDLSVGIISKLGIYTDDATIHFCFDKKPDKYKKIKLADDLENDLHYVGNWLKK